MKRKDFIPYILVGIVISLVVFSCKSTEPSLEKQQQMARLKENIEKRNYTFIATSAIPLGFRQIDLTSEYTLEVKNDTIKCRLPYFGTSYVAPLDPNQIGINFTSTDFDYQIKEKKNTWEITITLNDNKDIRKLFLTAGNTGFASLSVQPAMRQVISFNGTIE